MAKPLTWPGGQLGDGLGGRSAVESLSQVLPADHTEDLDVDNVWRRLVLVGGKSLAKRLT